jgi:polyhydroxyalkanoate synthesis regulator protein
MDLFSEAMRMWVPFAASGKTGAPGGAQAPGNSTDSDGGKRNKEGADVEEIEALRRQLGEMQKTIETIAQRK